MLVTVPLRESPTTFPPVGCLSLIKYLRKHGIDDVEFFDIDCMRPSYEHTLARITDAKPDILGISAVVSTSYEFTRKLSLDVKRLLPDTLIVVGGNLAASAELLLRKTGTDLCVLGEGEKVLLNIIKHAKTTRSPFDFADIPGLMLLDRDGSLVNTGYEAALPADQIYDIDYDDLARFSNLDNFVSPAFDGGTLPEWLKMSSKAWEPHRRNKKYTTLQVGKGCVARCTFCHRWDKGIRHIPVDLVISRLDALVKKFDVGFLDISIETFAADKRWLKEFCAKIKPYDILWRAGGIRANAVTRESIAIMAEAGCASLIFGHESGSRRMLEVIEKKVKLEDNQNSVVWTIDAGLWTVIQLVLGMPGETEKSIEETLDFVEFAFSQSPQLDPVFVSATYAQALPGTPLFEFARRTGRVESGLEGEERYLILISDENAATQSTAINYSECPTLVWMTWQRKMLDRSTRTYIQTFGAGNLERLRNGEKPDMAIGTTENPTHLSKEIRRRFGVVRNSDLLPLITLYEQLRMGRLRSSFSLSAEYIMYKVRTFMQRQEKDMFTKSLRKAVRVDLPAIPNEAPEMLPLRQGR